ncbi:outer membrane adhesin like protein [Methylobacterium sp. 4-46]|uniref:VCBS domain-containing protein n=1 Tax=unclassified Methylobacterium TaxID=2615210 RepID=UPI000165C703|nr:MULTISPECIES: VCBS domain-containing protein [Methylobacterium]ACA17733.1 outer membrane adhesin like protein [Methylobacterium sp. 4-46]WFT83402.1 VCBS domain-containing protein [Methylobacterium nodulans]
MATIANTSTASVTFSNSTAAANMAQSIVEDNALIFSFDVLKASGGGTNTTVYSVDDGIKNDDGGAAITVTNTAFANYNKDLLIADQVGGAWEYKDVNWNGNKYTIAFRIGSDNKIVVDARSMASAVDAMAAGDIFSDSIQYTIKMANGTLSVGTLTYTIVGQNDAAVIGNATNTSVIEDVGVTAGKLVASGTISVSDADHDQSYFQTTVTPGAVTGTTNGAADTAPLGTLIISANGNYSYSVDNSAVQYLRSGESRIESFTIKSADGTSKVVSFTVNGANDVAVIGNASNTSVTEDAGVTAGKLVASGTISVSDADHDQASFQMTVTKADGTLGDLVLNTDGTYTYSVANSAVQYLGASDSKVETFTIKSADGTTKDVSFTIHGANDAAVIGDPTVADVTEDANVNGSGNLTAAGSISISDADQNQASFQTTVTKADGTLGDLVLNTDGSYTYSVANSAVQFLGASDSKVETFTVTAQDGTTKQVSFTIHGANDAAVIGDPTVADVTEDANVNGSGNLTAAGSISISDADQNQASFQTTVTKADGTLGDLVLNTDGSYTYSVANSAVQFLGASDSKVETFTVTAQDGTTKQVSFTIHGANDAAVIGDPTVADVTEDVAINGSGNLTASGTISISDADQNQATFLTSVTKADGTLGDLVLNTDGSYTYSVANSAVQYLGASDSKVETFTIKSADGTTKDVSFTIHGANDAAVIGTPTVADVTEDVAINGSGNLTASGTISISDADQNQASFQTTVTKADGTLGDLVLNTDGSYTYSVANSAVQFLGASDSKVETFTVTAQDGTTKQVSFTIHGANDAAVIGDPTVADVTEDANVNGSGNLTAAGSISISDADQNQASFQTTVTKADGTLGDLVLNTDGSYTYSVANSAVQFLGASDSKVETFTIKSADGTTKDVSFTIHGANDAAVIGTPTVADVTEDVAINGSGNLTASGTISISDADQNQATFLTSVTKADGTLGDLVLNTDGSYTYSVANSAVQFLGASDSKVETFTIKSADGTTKDVSFTIHGANDAAVIGTPTVADVTEDVAINGSGNLTASGTISISDADQNQASFQTTVTKADGTLGDLVLNTDGSYTYSVANSAVQFLGASDSKVETFTVTAQDGTTKQVSFTIHGANDAAVIGDPTVADVTEDANVNGSGNLTAAGSISISDADQNQASFQTTVTKADGTLGDLVLNTDGSYTYSVANSAVQFLGASDSKVETFTVTAQDGTTKQVSFTIHGANDAAVIGDPTVADVTEDVAINGSGNLTASGTISISDADQNQASFQTTVTKADGTLGDLVLNTDGSYTYSVANSAVQFLGASDSKVETFTVTAQDGTTKQVSFTIHGANDAAVIGDPTVADVTEDANVNGSGNLTAAGSISISDADQNQASFQTTVTKADGTLGDLVLNTDGSYTYSVANSAVQFLGASDSKVETFTIKSADGTTKDVSFTIHGANDAAVIGTPTVADVTEDVAINGSGNLTASGTISISDADQNQASFQTTVTKADGTLGDLVLNTDGSYTYSVANSAVQFLGASDSKVETFTIKSADGTTKDVSFTIHGANDAAVIGTPTVADVTEDVAINGSGNLTASGTISISDADQNQASFQTTVTKADGTLGDLVLNTDGTYTYSVANSAVQYLGASDSKVETFTIKSADGTTKDVSFTIHGANDAAVIGTPTVADVTEDVAINGSGNLTASGTISISDADQNQASFQTTVTKADGTLGDLVLNTDGSYTYSVANSAVQFLGASDSKVETFTVTAQDGTTKQVSFTIHGANDAAVIGDPTVADVTEDANVNGSGNLTAAGSISISDADQNQASFQTTVTKADGTLGDLVLNTDGSYTYSVANSAVQFLGASDSKVETFTVTAQDGTTKQVSFTIHGANDAAVIGDPTVADVTEDANVNGSGNLTAAGSISISDADQNQASFQTTVTKADGTLGDLVLNTDGSYTYSVANSAVQFLGASDSKVETFTVTAQDGTTKQVSFTIHGANDAAVIGDPTVADVTEDTNVSNGNLTATGSISITDADQNQATFLTSVTKADGTLGDLVLNTDGTYTYSVANSAVQFLGASDSKVETFTIKSADGTTKDVSFTIHGANDAAVIGTPTVADVTEDANVNGSGNLTATGSISITDADQNQATFLTSVTKADGTLGSLTLAADGTYTYSVANSAVQFLGASDSKVETFTIKSADGTTKDVSFTIHGANDAAVIGTPTVADVTEDVAVNGSGNLTASGSISITDADQNQASFQTTVTKADGTLGSLTLAANGTYTYSVANSAVQFLGASDTKVDTFTVTALDGTTKQVSFTVQGANDAAVIGTPSVSTVTEDVAVNGSGNLTATGTISISDADQNQASLSTTVTAAQGTLGSLSLAANGSYTYSVANSAVQYLGAGQTRVETFTIKSADGTTKDVSFTVQGANDAAVIGTPSVSTVTEDVGVNGSGNLTATGSISISDADQNQASFSTTVAAAQGNLGTLSLAANGTYTYTVANSAVQFLGASDTKVDTFTVTALDGTTKQVSFTVQGANDAAVIGTPSVSTVTEDVAVNGSGNLTATGTISISDADQNQASLSTTVTAAQGTLGSLSLAANGSYTYSVANSAVQYLGAGQTRVETFTIKSADGTTKDVSFTVQGANDAAVIGTPSVSTVTEDVGVNGSGNLTATGSISISDADQNQASFSTTVAAAQGNLGTLSLAANGTYTYTVANSAVQFLGASDTKVDTFTVTALDGTTKQVSFTVQGANDAAVIGTPSVSTVTEDVAVNGSGNLTATGTISISDADQNQASLSTTVTAAQGTLGSLSLAANGSYTYSVANSAVQFLNSGESRVETFTVKALDGTTKDVSFTINGADEAVVAGTATINATPGTPSNKTTVTVQFSKSVFAPGESTDANSVFDINDFRWNGQALPGNFNVTGSLSSDGKTWTGTFDVPENANDAAGTLSIASTYKFKDGSAGATASQATTIQPAGATGEPLNLALMVPSSAQGEVTVTIKGIPSDWTLSSGIKNADGSWTVTTTDVASLSVTTPATYVGAAVLNVALAWTNTDGTTGTTTIADNVEAYAKGSPIFAWSGHDTLTGSTAADLFVFGNPIGEDKIYSFDAAADKIDLIGYGGFKSFTDVQAHLADDATGSAVVTLADGQTITLDHVHASDLSAANFVFDQTPAVTNSAAMVLSDGAMLPLSGAVTNTGTIALNSTGGGTLLQVIDQGITLTGGGTVKMSDDDGNTIAGTKGSVTLTNLDNTISGAGQLGGGALTLTNQASGKITADGSHALVIDTGTTVVENAGTLAATGSGGLVVKGALDNTGTVWAHGGNVTVEGAVTGSGTALIDGNATMEFGAASSAHVDLGHGDGTLKLDDSLHFNGSITGFGAGDHVDLADLLFGSSTSVSYAANAQGTGGLLNVSDGVHTAALALQGTYDAAAFSLTKDSDGHALVSYDPLHHGLA